MTEKQAIELNSKVMRYQLNKPMKWLDFKNMPVHIQGEYLNHLREAFGVNTPALGKMFGLTAQGVCSYLKIAGIPFPRTNSHMTEHQHSAWNDFIKDIIPPPIF